ncbi:MAG: hypothetical protein ACON4U_04360 [Myxococcota bacterium]
MLDIDEHEAYVSATRKVLSNLKAGLRVWFWFCGAHLKQFLFLSSLSSDPTAEALSEIVSAPDAPTGVTQYIGLMSVKHDGQIELSFQKSSLTMLFEAALEYAATVYGTQTASELATKVLSMSACLNAQVRQELTNRSIIEGLKLQNCPCGNANWSGNSSLRGIPETSLKNR